MNMKRIPILYPVLFALIPVLRLLAANLNEVPFAQTLRPLLICALLSTGITLGLGWWLKEDAHRAGFIAFLIVFGFFYYHITTILISFLAVDFPVTRYNWGIFIFWLLFLGGLGSRWLWRKIKHPSTITSALTVAGLVILSISVGAIGFYYVERLWFKPPRQSGIDLQGKQKPDIYYIIVDGYAADEILAALYAYDNTEFVEFLQQHGFYVAGQARSNYIQTTLSLASSLNLDYLPVMPRGSANRSPMHDLLQHSVVRSTLESYGYQMVALASGYHYTEFEDADFYLMLSNISKLSMFELFLLMTSPMSILIENTDWFTGLLPTGVTQQDRILHSFEQLKFSPSIPGPKFVFAHIIAPHPPFVFDKDGNLTSPEFFGFSDGDRFPGSRADYITGYVGQLSYINTLLMQTLDVILKESAIPPVIILQADHGPGAWLNWESVESSCLWERASILNAYYLPELDSVTLYDSVTPVNSFRIVFDAYFGTELGLLEDRTYYSTWSRPYDFIDVTEASREPCQLP